MIDELEQRRQMKFGQACDGVMAAILTGAPISFVFPSELYAERVSEEVARRFHAMATPIAAERILVVQGAL